jgi:hypothetical protein
MCLRMFTFTYTQLKQLQLSNGCACEFLRFKSGFCFVFFMYFYVITLFHTVPGCH